MQQQTVDWNNIIARIKGNEAVYCIMEEPVDAEVQKSFIQLKERLSADKSYFDELCKAAEQNPDFISDSTLPLNILKRTLVALSSTDSIPNFRVLERFVSNSEGIRQKWGIVALQQSRMLVKTSLYGNSYPGIFISSGLGGVGQRLRYFCVFSYKNSPIEPFQEELLHDECLFAVNRASGEVETFSLSDSFATMTFLLPIECNLAETVRGIMSECNRYGNYLNRKLIVTNIKELTREEIMKHINGKGK